MYDSPNQEVVLIYGRRRIGKSELIKQFLKTSKIQGLYYQCKRTTEMNNVQSLSALISEVYQYPPLAFTGMEKLLDFLFQQACGTPLRRCNRTFNPTVLKTNISTIPFL